MEKECKKICNLHCVPDDKFIDGLRPLQKSFYTQKLLLIINELYL